MAPPILSAASQVTPKKGCVQPDLLARVTRSFAPYLGASQAILSEQL